MANFCGPFCGRFRDELQGSSDEDDDDEAEDGADKEQQIRVKKRRGGFWGKYTSKTKKRGAPKPELSSGASAALRWSQHLNQISVQVRQKRGEVAMSQVLRLQIINKTDVPSSMYNCISELAGLHTIEIVRCDREEVPTSLPEMDSLSTLRMSHNRLTRFDETLAKTKQIERILLDWNQISDIPQGVFSHRSFLNLEALNLSHNKLTILPADFGKTQPMNQGSQSSQIKFLDLSNNSIQALPETVARHCTNLEVLNLSHNNLKTLGNRFQLPKLQRLFISFNELVELPNEIGACSELGKIRIISNQIRELPESILRLWKKHGGKLEELLVDRNPLVMPSITTFHMAANNEQGINQGFELFEDFLADKRKQLAIEEAAAARREAKAALALADRNPSGYSSLQNALGDVVGGSAMLQVEDAHLTGVNLAQHNYYFGHCSGDKAKIAELRNVESTLLLLKKRIFCEGLKAIAKKELSRGQVSEQHLIFVQPDFDPIQYTGKILVTEVDLYFSLLVMSTKPMFSTCHVLFDKFEIGNKGFMTRDEWAELCICMPIVLTDSISDQMWDLMCWRGHSNVLLDDFVAAWHIHDVEARDPWIARITELLGLDYYDMESSELVRRLNAKSAKDATPDLDFDQAMGGDRAFTAQGDAWAEKPLDAMDSLDGLLLPRSLNDDNTRANHQSQQDHDRRTALLQQVSLSDEQQREYEALTRQAGESDEEDANNDSFSSKNLSEGEESDQSEFDAQAWLQRHTEFLAADQNQFHGPPIVVDGDVAIRQLMELPPAELLARSAHNQQHGGHGREQEDTTGGRLVPSGGKKKTKHDDRKRLPVDPSMKTDVFAVRQSIRRLFRNLPYHDFATLINFLLRGMQIIKHSPSESLSYWHADDPTFKFSMGSAGTNRYTRSLLRKMGFVMLNQIYWVWPCVHLDPALRCVPSCLVWGDAEVPTHCPGKDKRRLDDMIFLLIACQRALNRKNVAFTGHFKALKI